MVLVCDPDSLLPIGVNQVQAVLLLVGIRLYAPIGGKKAVSD